MKSRLLSSMLLVAGSCFAMAHAGELTVTITGIHSTKGHLVASIVNSDAGWNYKEKPVAEQKAAIEGKEAVLHFNLPAGSYAFQVFHDENDNGQLDFNAMHIPSEPYGYSNNPHVMRRAYFSEVRFDVGDKPQSIEVKLQ